MRYSEIHIFFVQVSSHHLYVWLGNFYKVSFHTLCGCEVRECLIFYFFLGRRGGVLVIFKFFCSHSIVDFSELYVFGDLFVIVHLFVVSVFVCLCATSLNSHGNWDLEKFVEFHISMGSILPLGKGSSKLASIRVPLLLEIRKPGVFKSMTTSYLLNCCIK